MSKIDIASLGGLNENGKNIYVVNVDDNIFVFDAGLKFAMDKMYGIDYIIPSFKYLVDNKEKIAGVFISHAHQENMGALSDLVREIPELKVYATNFACEIIKEDANNKGVEIKNLITIEPHKKININKELSVFPFSVTHSSPETVGYVINTKDGAIVYMADFIIDPTMTKPYDMDLGKIAYVGKQGVLFLMAESVFSEKQGHTSPNHKLTRFFEGVIDKSEGRVLFSVLPLHIYTIQQIFDAIKDDRKVVIMGKKLQNIVSIAFKTGSLKFDQSKIGDLRDLKKENTIVIVGNERENAYANLSRIVNGYDKYITLEKTDTICFSEPSYDAYELLRVNLMDQIAKLGANLETVPDKNSVRLHASAEDIMLLIKLFNPKFYMPIKGEYRYQVGNAKLAEKVGIKPENIFLKENGDIVRIVDKKAVECFDKLEVDTTIIDGKAGDDLGEVVIKDREVLGDSGLLLISVTLNKKTKTIEAGPEILTKGFIYAKDNMDMIEEMKEMTIKTITENTKGTYADYQKIKNDLREILSKYVFNKTACKPIILTVIQEI